MGKQSGNSLIETKRLNRVLIKNAIYRNSNATRTSIAKELGLTLATLSTSVGEMLEEHILEEVEQIDKAGVGRKARKIGFCADCALAIGIDVTVHYVRGVLLNMHGEVLKSMQVRDSKSSYEVLIQNITEVSRSLLPDKMERLVGIGIGIPGFIDIEKGIIQTSVFEKWKGEMKIKEDVETIMGVPVLVDNNVHMRAYGYDLDPKQPNTDMFAYFFNLRGLACPIIKDSILISGNSSGAGELGHTVIFFDGNKKTLNDVATEYELLCSLQEGMLSEKLKNLKKNMQERGLLTIDLILEVYKSGDQEVVAHVNRILRMNGIGAANVINLINPEVMVCDSHLFQLQECRRVFENAAKECLFGIEKIEFRYFENSLFTGAIGSAYRAIKILFLDA